MKMKELGALVLLASMWGASFLFMKVAVAELGPLVTSAVRVLLAGLALLAYALLIGSRPDLLSRWKQYLLLGAINAALPFALICAAELHLAASLAAILNATTPLFTALVALGWLREPIGWRKGAGLLLGVFGVSILVGWHPDSLESGSAFYTAAGLSLLAALSYAFGGIYASRTFTGTASLDLAVGQQLAASVWLVPVALVTLPEHLPSMATVWSVLALSLLCTAVAYLLYFFLLQSVGPVKTLSVTFLVPLFGVVWGTIFLNESLSMNTLLGLIVIFVSILMVTLQKKKKLLPTA
ncbi:DMT family transporter [Tumebacillus sp. DT12]|uniref:DMT family transporter n=1 Tax=Tumebacillus lacus TaxID=2995335 RepID=A0ABT3X3C8_9BACL|nr:DMT family transporter [Tumebacillus lacus]MCX7569239.1 DMT family transporter [Tumebacillus lacus]